MRNKVLISTRKKVILVSLVLLNFFCSALANTTEGKEFWLTFTPNANTPSRLALFISSQTGTSGVVEYFNSLGDPVSAPFTVASGQVATIELPVDLAVITPGVHNRAIRVSANDSVAVYGLNQNGGSTDAFTAIPIESLGTDYYAVGYRGLATYQDQINLVATEDNTQVTLTFPSALGLAPVTTSLMRGQGYYYDSLVGELTGTRIISDKVIAVTSGNKCTYVPATVGTCDHLVEFTLPKLALGREYISHPLKTRLNGDTFRIVATENMTDISINGAVVATGLMAGDYHEQIIEGAASITANHAISVSQYSNGILYDNVDSDPFMMHLLPNGQFLQNYTIATADLDEYDLHYLNIIVETANVSTLLMDGTPLVASFSPVAGTSYSSASLKVSEGSHHLTSTNGITRFGVYVYGFAFADSYGYFGGGQLSAINTVLTLTALPLIQTYSLGEQSCTAINVKDSSGKGLANTIVDIAVTGISPISTTVTTDTAGEANYCYTRSQTGNDNIEVKVELYTTSVTRTWSATPAAPVLVDDAYTVPAGTTPFEMTVLSNDAIPDAGSVITVFTQPSSGAVVASATAGQLTYTPVAGFVGDVSFTYTVCDTASQCAVANVALSIKAGVPVLVDDAYTVPAGTSPFNMTVLSNDAIPDAGSVITVFTQPSSGAVVASATAGQLTYTPVAGFVGDVSFTYTVCDTASQCAVANVALSIKAGVPVLVDDAYTVPAGTTPIELTVLSNDAIPDAGSVITVFTQPSSGAVVASATAGQLTYTPVAGFVGDVSFTYTVCDTASQCAVANVALSIKAGVPVLVDDAYTVPAGTSPFNMTVLSNDAIPDAGSVITVFTQPSSGAVVASATAGQLTYTPVAGFVGDVSFTYTVCDTASQCAVANVALSIKAGVPVLVDDAYTVPAGTSPFNMTVLSNDAIPDAGSVITVFTQPSSGAVVASATAGQLTYTPVAGFVGDVSFTYTVCDTASQCAVANVALSIKAGVPVLVDDAYTVPAGTSPFNMTVLSNDAIPDAGSVITVFTQPSSGAVVASATAGQLTYTPVAGFVGDVSFTYTVCDTASQCAVANVALSIKAGVPVLVDDAYTVPAGTSPFNMTVLSNDAIPDAGSVITVFTQPSSGAVVASATAGQLMYTPVAGFVGDVSFTYTVCDTASQCAVANVALSIKAGVPVLVDDAYTVPAGTSPFNMTVLSNDAIPDAGSVITVFTQPSSGAVVASATAGQLTYTPVAGFVGDVSFTYTVCDTASQCAVANVALSIKAGVPVLVDDAYTVPAGTTPIELTVLSNDAIPDAGSVITVFTQPSSGAVVASATAGQLTYTPVAGFVGDVSFTYTVCDTASQCAVANVALSIKAGVPVLVDDAYTVPAGTTPIELTVLSNDYIPDAGSVITELTQPSSGIVELAESTSAREDLSVLSNDVTSDSDLGSSVFIQPRSGMLTMKKLTYTPGSRFTGSTSFSYTVCDTVNQCATAKVNLQVRAVVPIAGSAKPIPSISLFGLLLAAMGVMSLAARRLNKDA